jgi:archaeal type IV pilus assembly protein PilA
MIHPLRNEFPNDLSSSDPAVSPVVGIMLMLTVTLILAAIISGMTGGIAKTQQKPQQHVFKGSVVNSGPDYEDSFLDIRVISVSEGIPSRDLKFQTEWRDKDRQTHRTTVTSGMNNVGTQTYPLGSGTMTSSSNDFGNFTILAGTRLNANASVEGAMDAVLNESWGEITDGTPIRIQFVHIPSGAIIADKEITAEV